MNTLQRFEEVSKVIFSFSFPNYVNVVRSRRYEYPIRVIFSLLACSKVGLAFREEKRQQRDPYCIKTSLLTSTKFSRKYGILALEMFFFLLAFRVPLFCEVFLFYIRGCKRFSGDQLFKGRKQKHNKTMTTYAYKLRVNALVIMPFSSMTME